MKKKISLQIQAVLYKNDPKSLKRSLYSLANALSYAKKQEILDSAVLHWGDASPTPVFSQNEIDALQNEFDREITSDLSVSYTFFDENTGYGRGHNLLFAQCDSEYVLILNPDIVVCYDFFTVMLEAFRDERVGLVEARQTPIEHPKYYDKKTGETPWASGACFIMPSALYRELGGFDEESFFMYCEDVDLSFRIRQKGKKLIYCPGASVYHSKKFDSQNGELEHTETELRYSVEAQLVLAYKWKRRLMLRSLKSACKDGTEFQKKALESFLDRLSKGELKRIEGDTSVFKKRYLKNRFSM